MPIPKYDEMYRAFLDCLADPKQIETVLAAYRDAIYTDLYPDRAEKWEYIPKTLIFAKDDNHATEIVNEAKKVFGEKFPSGKVPERFVQKITYSADNPNDLIRDLRIEKDFRIAVTVTLVATGTDVRPLEVVLFMNDVKSDILYTQMKGRGCRTINDDKLKEITPNAETKECYYIVDAVGVTESDKTIPKPGGSGPKIKVLTLEHPLATKPMTRENLDDFVASYCSGHIQDRVQTYSEENPNGRWRKFTEEEVYSRDQLKLDFKWLDLGEKDDRTITEILNDMQSKSAAITDAVAKLQEILGGIDL